MTFISIAAYDFKNNIPKLGLTSMDERALIDNLRKATHSETSDFLKDLASKLNNHVSNQTLRHEYGWVNVPHLKDSILVEKRTGYALLSLDGKLIMGISRLIMPTYDFNMEKMFKDVRDNEGDVDHLYLDSVGEVTVGVGKLVTSAQALINMHNEEKNPLFFVDKVTNEPATEIALKKEFEVMVLRCITVTYYGDITVTVYLISQLSLLLLNFSLRAALFRLQTTPCL